MTHRDLSLTGWITNETHGDDAKHIKALRETGYICTVLPQSLYDRAEAAGYDMLRFVPNRPLPASHPLSDLYRKMAEVPPEARLGTRKNVKGYPGARGRKHLDERQCGGKEIACLYNQGRCVACARDD